MGGSPKLEHYLELPEEIKQNALNGTLVLFVGAGVSRLIGIPGWENWADYCFNVLCKSEKIKDFNYSDAEQLKSLTAKQKLSIAFQIATRYGLSKSEFIDCFKMEKKSEPSIYTYLNKIGSVFVTTNYDEFLEPTAMKNDDAKTTNPATRRIYAIEKLSGYHLRNPGTVIHLHGAISRPERMVVSTKDYLTQYEHENVKELLEELFEKYTVLFLGYGLEETEILEYILRKGKAREEKERKRFYLNGYLSSQSSLYRELYEYYKESFGVHLMGFSRDKTDYDQLTEIIKKWSEQIIVNTQGHAADFNFMEEVLKDEK